MPKLDALRAIDAKHGANGKNGITYITLGTPILAPNPAPATVHSGVSGQWYIGPSTLLVQSVSSTDDSIVVADDYLLDIGDEIVLSDGRGINEVAQVSGGPVAAGAYYRYTLTRTDGRSFPAGGTVTSLGGVEDGGYIVINSGERGGAVTKAPHLNLWERAAGGDIPKLRLGKLANLQAALKAEFPGVSDEEWAAAGYGIAAAGSAYFAGKIWATGGQVQGDLDVSGTLGVWSGLGRAGVVMGESEGGHGIVLQNKEGRPVFAAISPYEDASGTLNEVALYIEHEGEKGLYYHKNAATGEYQLDIGVNTLVDGALRAANILAGTGTYPNAFTGMRFGAEGLQSYGTDFLPQVELDVQDGRLYFGGREGWLDRDGMVIDTRQLAQGTDALDHTIRWIRQTNMIESGWRVGAAIGSEADALFATSRTYYGDLGIPNADPNQFYQAELWLQAGPNDTTYLTAPNVEIRGDTSSALTVGRLNPVRAALDGAGRFSAPRLTVGGNALHVTDDGATVAIGSNTATGAKVVAESDTMAQFRGQRSDGQYVALTAAPNAESWVSASGTLVLAPAAGQTGQKYVLPPADQTIALGSQARKFSDVYAQNGHFGALGSQTSLAGQFYLTKRRATLAVGLEADNTTVYVFEDDLLEGEFYRFEDVDGNWEVIRINTVGIPTGDGWYEHEVERQQGADVDNSLGLARLWDAGAVGVSLGGNAQDGYIRLFGADDQNPNTGPAIVVMQRDNDDDPNSVSERAVFGNLNGWYGYGENKYGVAFGTHAGRWVSLDEAEGLRIMEGDQQQAVYREYVQIGRPDGNNVFITDSTLALRTGETAYIEMDNAGNLDLTGTLAVATGGAITWAGGKGTADDTGMEHVEDASNYFSVKPDAFYFLRVASQATETSLATALLETDTGIGCYGLATGAGYGVMGVVNAEGGTAIYGNGNIGAATGVKGSAGTGGVGVLGNTLGGVAVKAQVTITGTALQISGGIVDGGSQRYTNLANAAAATDAMNQQSSDARYAPIASAHAAVTLDANADTLLSLSTQQLGLDTQTANRILAGPTTGAAAVPTFRALVAGDIPSLSQYLLATGATTGASSQAQTFTNGIIGPSWKPSANSTTALQMQKADGTYVLDVDTTNGRVGVGTNAPARLLDVSGDSRLYGNIYAKAGGVIYTESDTWQHGLYIKNSSGNLIAYFGPQYRNLVLGGADYSSGSTLTVKPVTNLPALVVQAYSGQTTDVVQFQDLGGNNAYRLTYDNQHIFLGQMMVGGRANSAPSYDRLQGASQRYGVTFTNCTATSADALFNGMHSGAAMMCNAATNGQVEIDFNPFIGYAANTNSGYTHPAGHLLITFYSTSAAASDITVEAYRPSGGADGWATISTTTGNTAATRLITIGATFNYLKKLRVTVSHASQAVWVAGISYFPTSPESGIEAQNIQMYVPSTLAIANKGLYLYDTTWTSRTKLDYKVANGASAVAYLWDTANALSTAGAKLASWRNNGTEHTFIDRYGGLTVNESGADSDTRIEGDTDANLFFLDASADSIGIGTNAPSARLHIKAGGTAAGSAPLKLTTQVAGLTTVEQGAFELVGNSLQFTQLAKRRGVPMSQATLTSSVTTGNTTTESAALITAEHGANYLEVGKCEEIVLRGKIQQTGTGSGQLQVRVKYAGTTKQTITTNTGVISANTPCEIRVTGTVRSVGASGTMQLNSVLWIDGIANIPDTSTLATIDTTTAQNITITVQWTVANASNTITIDQGRVLCIEPNK